MMRTCPELSCPRLQDRHESAHGRVRRFRQPDQWAKMAQEKIVRDLRDRPHGGIPARQREWLRLSLHLLWLRLLRQWLLLLLLELLLLRRVRRQDCRARRKEQFLARRRHRLATTGHRSVGWRRPGQRQRRHLPQNGRCRLAGARRCRLGWRRHFSHLLLPQNGRCRLGRCRLGWRRHFSHLLLLHLLLLRRLCLC